MTREDIIEGLNKVENELCLKHGDEDLANQIHNISEALRLNQLSFSPAESADDLKQYMTNLLYSAYDKGAKQVEPSESDRKDLDQWVEEMINGIDEYFKSKQLTAEGAEEILKRHCKENKIILTSNDFHTWLNAINEIATLHAQQMAEKMVEERLREELIAYDKYASRWIDNYRAETAEDCVDEYLKSKEQ